MRSFRTIIDSSLDAVPAVGNAVRALCRDGGFAEADAAMVELGVVEAVNNAIEHACSGAAGGRIEIAVSVDGTRIDARIVDDGQPGDPAAFGSAQAPAFDPADRASLPEGGFGLSVIRSVFDEVSFARDGGRNVLTLRRTRSGA